MNQGIGSSMNRCFLLFATLMNATLIPNPDCFRSTEHGTDYLISLAGRRAWSTALDVANAGSTETTSRLLPIEIEYGYSKAKQMQNDQAWKKHNSALVHTCKMYGRGRLSQDTEAFWAHHSRNQESVFYPIHKAMEKAKEKGSNGKSTSTH